MSDPINIKVLMITTEWPSPDSPFAVPFLVKHVENLRSSGINVAVFHFHGKGQPINYLKAWLAVRRTPHWQNADILHAQWGQSAFLSIFSPKPLVITYHGSDLQGIVNKHGKYKAWGRLLVTFSRLIAKKADQIIVVSEHMKSLLPVDNNSIQVIPMGIDLSRFKPLDQNECRQRLGLDLEKKYIIFANDPNRPEKRYSLARQATKYLMASGLVDNVELLVVYDQPHEKMPYYLNASDVLLMTSSHEGSPVIIKEALACNLPIVSVDVGDVKERISNIKGNYLCPDDLVETIAHYLTQALINNRPINGREAVYDLDWNTITEKTISIYQKCLSKILI